MNDSIDFELRIGALERKLKQVEASMTGFRIDKQLIMQADNKVTPGIGVKVAYDRHGRITGNMPISQDDIPAIPISKVTGLSKILEDTASKAEINSLSTKLNAVNNHTKTVKTGTVVNVDEHGLVNDVSELLPEHIPTLPMDKIQDLSEIIQQLRHTSNDVDLTCKEVSVTSGVGTKVTWDEHGHIISSQDLNMEDLPSELDKRIAKLEELVADIVSRTEMNEVVQVLNDKIDKPKKKLTPGVYTKVIIDENGIVTDAEELTDNDIPALSINAIDGLDDKLSSMATNKMVAELSESTSKELFRISSLVENIPQAAQTVSVDEFNKMRNDYKLLSELVNTLIQSVPSDQIMQELEDIKQDISTLRGELASIANK